MQRFGTRRRLLVIVRFILTSLLVAVIFLTANSPAQELEMQGNDFGPRAVAIDHLRNLEYTEAKQQLRQWVEGHPTDLLAWNYLATPTLYQEMFQRGVLESRVYGQGGEAFKPSKVAVTPEFQKELLAVLDKAQGLAEEKLKADRSDKDALYWAGVSHGTRATYHFVLRKEYMPALHEATEAYRCHSQLLNLDPKYVDAYLIVGMNNYIVGSLPWYIKVLAALTGRHGDRAEGLQQVKRVTEGGHYAREDAKLMLAVLYEREKMYAQALTLYREMGRSYPRNYLLQYEAAALCGLLNDWRTSASGYESIVAKHRGGESGYKDIPLAKVLYRAGQAHEHLQEWDDALARYTEAGSLPGSDRHIYLCNLAAADLQTRLNHPDQARLLYQRVADAVPDSDEGGLARRALKKLNAN